MIYKSNSNTYCVFTVNKFASHFQMTSAREEVSFPEEDFHEARRRGVQEGVHGVVLDLVQVLLDVEIHQVGARQDQVLTEVHQADIQQDQGHLDMEVHRVDTWPDLARLHMEVYQLGI